MRPPVWMAWLWVAAGALLVGAAPRASETLSTPEAEGADEGPEAEQDEVLGRARLEPSGTSEEPFGAQDCTAVFGDDAARADNSSHRRAVHLAVEQGAYCISVSHSTDWTAPTPLDLDQLELVKTCLEPEAGAQALVYLDQSFEEQGCAEGYYLLEPDGAIGADARVLAVLDDVLLLEHAGELRYLRVDGAPLPEWRMLWHSPWVIVKPPDYGKAKMSASRQRAARQRAAKASRAKRKRARKRGR